MGAVASLSRVEADIEARLQDLDPGSKRYQTLRAARDFKAAWVGLAKALTQVRDSGEFQTWGYATFEAYCGRELKIRRDTADKLTRSFAFLREHKPDVLDRQRESDMPALDVVDLLQRARAKASVPEEAFVSLRDDVLADGKQSTRTQVLKRLREVDPEGFGAGSAANKDGKSGLGVKGLVAVGGESGEGEASRGPVDLKKAVMLAERLQSVVEAGDGLSGRTVAMICEIAAELRARFDATQMAASA